MGYLDGYVAKYEKSERAIAEKTARRSGAVGGKSVLPDIVKSLATTLDSILDYGAGYGQNTIKLRKAGLSVFCYDFNPERLPKEYTTELKLRRYDIVFASNVLNVQSSILMLDKTLQEINSELKPTGLFIANLPSSPNKIKDYGHDMILNRIIRVFNVVVVKKYSSGYIFICQNNYH